MLIVISNTTDQTADYLCGRLLSDGVPFRRLDSDIDLGEVQIRYSGGPPVLLYRSEAWSACDFSHVWFRRPEPLKINLVMEAAEHSQALSEWSEALEGFLAHIPTSAWMNHPALNACASHKMEQLSRASRLGFRVPRTIVTQDPSEVRRFWQDCKGRVIVKPLGDGYLQRDLPALDTHIFANKVTEDHLEKLDLVANCPTLFQEQQIKKCDVRIIVTDEQVDAVALFAEGDDGGQRLDIRRDNMADVRYSSIEVPEEVQRSILSMVKSYGLRFSAIDMAVTSKNEWMFFEVNPNGQWAWLDLAGGCDIAGSFVKAFSR
jgi:hypothetical protein